MDRGRIAQGSSMGQFLREEEGFVILRYGLNRMVRG